MANVLFDGLPQVRTAESSILYAVALADSVDGEVLVRFADADELEPGIDAEEEMGVIVEAFDDDEYMADGAPELVEDDEIEDDDYESIVDDYMEDED